MKSSLIYILLTLLALSILANFILLKQSISYYKLFKLAQVYPTNKHYYAEKNKQLKWFEGKKRVILFGDSRIKEWLPLPAHPDFQFINRGISGETTVQMRARFESDTVMLKPDIVIIQAGINDIVASAQDKRRTQDILRQGTHNLNYFIDTLNKHNIKVILTTIIPPAKPDLIRRTVWDNSISTHVELINQALLDITQQGVTVVDTRKLFMDTKHDWLPNINRDTLHLTLAGYRILNKAIIHLLAEKSNAF